MPGITRTSKARAALDPRLLIGLLLVAGSVAGVVGVVSAADETVEVLAAREALSPGDRVDVDDLDTRNVRLDAAAELYIAPSDLPSTGLVVTRAVAGGELLPASATGSVAGLRVTSVVIDVEGSLAASVRPTSLVDVWASSEVESGQYGPPVVIVSGATVVRLVESDSMVAGGDTTAIEVLVPKARVARVLSAVANSDALSIVPATIPGR
jgi:hypothetical protein